MEIIFFEIIGVHAINQLLNIFLLNIIDLRLLPEL